MAEGVKNADLVVEAATENIELKLEIFKQMDTCSACRLYPGNQYFFHFHHKNCSGHQKAGLGDRYAFYESCSGNETGRDHQWICNNTGSNRYSLLNSAKNLVRFPVL